MSGFPTIQVVSALILGAVGGYLLRGSNDSCCVAPNFEKKEKAEPQIDAEKYDDFKMVLVIRTDLGMGKGKVAAQCSHATLAVYKEALKKSPEILRNWEYSGQAKITLKCDNEGEMLELQKKARSMGLCARSIQDAGRTQIAAGSRTVLAIGPGPVEIINEVTGHLKLY
ncbi:PTH2-domain-containing protein [Basidiobolus meristosporus CBS 931.73]|uniref:peptidyl-tRNA hydrolase n=1 Tax=Basidiobolus meristosporus CBS 931.73 TaxID=1314790 RepID=A0A1Y1ZB99_9FUNG|nr:PTH2-domain-containing protein [Basidiobolus meristosporus CBS 931.73]|eukprot:ORY07583.1 PTH2-domain-containing protein [Basidiobolus meristosporus CBS 931.73]